MVYCDLAERPVGQGMYCGRIREGVINQLTNPNNGLPITIGEEEVLMMWENGAQEVHLTQHEFLSVNMGQFWFKDPRISVEFQYKGRIVNREYLGRSVDLICFQEVHHDNIYLTVIGEPWVIQYINENKRFMAEKPEAIETKENTIEDYRSVCWWTQADYQYSEELFDKDNNRLTTVDDYSYGDFIIYDTWDSIRRNRRKPILQKMIKYREEQIEKYEERIDGDILALIDIIGHTKYVDVIRGWDGETVWNMVQSTSEFQVEIEGTMVGKDMIWAIWKRYRIPELKAEIRELEKELDSY